MSRLNPAPFIHQLIQQVLITQVPLNTILSKDSYHAVCKSAYYTSIGCPLTWMLLFGPQFHDIATGSLSSPMILAICLKCSVIFSAGS